MNNQLSDQANRKLIQLKEKLRLLSEKVQKSIPEEIKSKKVRFVTQHSEFPSVKAFVIVNTTAQKAQILKLYRNVLYSEHHWRWTFKRVFCNCFWSIQDQMPNRYKLGGVYPIKTTSADIPSNIIWENVAFSIRLKRPTNNEEIVKSSTTLWLWSSWFCLPALWPLPPTTAYLSFCLMPEENRGWIKENFQGCRSRQFRVRRQHSESI